MHIFLVTRSNRKSTVVINIYRPPSGCQKLFLEECTKVINVVGITMIGDITIDHTPQNGNDTTFHLEAVLNSQGLRQCITKPTRVTNSTRTLLVVLFIKTEKRLNPYIIRTAISDHYLIGFVRYLGYSKPAGPIDHTIIAKRRVTTPGVTKVILT